MRRSPKPTSMAVRDESSFEELRMSCALILEFSARPRRAAPDPVRIGRYTIQGKALGNGGFGRVFKATYVKDAVEHEVALKVLPRCLWSETRDIEIAAMNRVHPAHGAPHNHNLNRFHVVSLVHERHLPHADARGDLLPGFRCKCKNVRTQQNEVQDAFCLVMEWCGGGDLMSVLQQHGAMPAGVARSYFAQFVRGLEALHQVHDLQIFFPT